MPEAPAPMLVLSMTRMSLPLPRPDLRSASPRCQAVLRPWMPAPMIRYLTWVGMAIATVPSVNAGAGQVVDERTNTPANRPLGIGPWGDLDCRRARFGDPGGLDAARR